PQHRIGAEALGVVLGTVGEVEKLAFRIYGSPLKTTQEYGASASKGKHHGEIKFFFRYSFDIIKFIKNP
ncbi:MAG: hypothetical protein KHY61_05300, partial [Sutterella wadsworthensis]|nr:hypothetical protein [Sutterella wadsworthensis]